MTRDHLVCAFVQQREDLSLTSWSMYADYEATHLESQHWLGGRVGAEKGRSLELAGQLLSLINEVRSHWETWYVSRGTTMEVGF